MRVGSHRRALHAATPRRRHGPGVRLRSARLWHPCAHRKETPLAPGGAWPPTRGQTVPSGGSGGIVPQVNTATPEEPLSSDRTALPRAEDRRPSTSGVVWWNVSTRRGPVNMAVLPCLAAPPTPSGAAIGAAVRRSDKNAAPFDRSKRSNLHPQCLSTAGVERNSLRDGKDVSRVSRRPSAPSA